MNKLIIKSNSIIPMINNNQTQLIFQRHCGFDRANGILLEDSKEYQKNLVEQFMEILKNNSDIESLNNTYFLFSASSTTSTNDFKRCVETASLALNQIKKVLLELNIDESHIINLSEASNYSNRVHEDKYLIEPKMFTDSTGFLEYLKDKHNGINLDFWIDFEEDLSKDIRESMGSEGPDEIVIRANRYIKMLQRYTEYFKVKYPNSRLIIWNVTHYDLISPLVKQSILNWDKSDTVYIDFCGGISLLLDKDNITASINGVNYQFDSQDKKQLQKHF